MDGLVGRNKSRTSTSMTSAMRTSVCIDANFAIELQKIESKVFIDKICKVLVGEGIIPYTIHDGLIVPKASTARTKEIMLEELKKVIGDYPTIKVS